ncbi:MAG TPA: CinA family protein [Candidatus Didemnitutus sp.]|nr:CinA family protein [Candidatus Didemnitutus sp.]
MNSVLELKQLLLTAPRQTLAVAESVTAGHLQARVASVSGASEFFVGGITAYNLSQKVRHLWVNEEHAAKVNCVSPRVAAEMARGVAALFGANIGVATTGYAEPSPEENVSAPMACWAIAQVLPSGEVRLHSGRLEFPGATRIDAQAKLADAVVEELISRLRRWRAET